MMKSLCFCWFGTTLISTLSLKDNFAENGILSGQVCSFDILNVCLLSPLACKLSVQKTAVYLGSFVCGESTFLFILSVFCFFLTFDNLIIMIPSVAFFNVT